MTRAALGRLSTRATIHSSSCLVITSPTDGMSIPAQISASPLGYQITSRRLAKNLISLPAKTQPHGSEVRTGRAV